jgi:hypothetical protein
MIFRNIPNLRNLKFQESNSKKKISSSKFQITKSNVWDRGVVFMTLSWPLPVAGVSTSLDDR